MQRVFETNPAIIWKLVHGEAVLLNPANGEYFGLNDVGSVIWQHLDGKKSLAEVGTLILAEYDVTPAVLEADMRELLAELQQKGLVRQTA
jgi:hypothetical protein